MSLKKTGRPPQYTEAQVLDGIARVEQNGEVPTGDAVKLQMCEHLDVPGGINAQSLDREVQRLLEERARARRERLIAALPPETRAAAKEIAAQLEGAVLEHMAEEHVHLRSAAGKKIVEMRVDLGSQRAQIRELLSKIDDKDGVITYLEGNVHDLEQRLAAAMIEIVKLKNNLVSLEAGQDFRAQMLELMRETLAQHHPSAA